MRTNKAIAILLMICLFASSATAAFAGGGTVATSRKVSVHLKPDITIKVGEQTKSFYDAEGNAVFPIIYNGTTYLPVRAVSGLMRENVEWDGESKTVFIGKTLKKPVKSEVLDSPYARDGGVPYGMKPLVQMVEAYVKPDIIIMYDFSVQRFSDVNGEDVYPLNYKGTVYLPVRAISKLMGESVEWDAGLKVISISDSRAEEEARKAAEEAALDEQKRERIRMLRSLYAEVLEIYGDATEKIASLQEEISAEQLETLADYVSDDLRRASAVASEIKQMGRSEFEEEELEAYDRLVEFAEASEYYILVLENIVYMAAAGQDYSIIAETFLSFAMDAQEKSKAAEEAMSEL